MSERIDLTSLAAGMFAVVLAAVIGGITSNVGAAMVIGAIAAAPIVVLVAWLRHRGPVHTDTEETIFFQRRQNGGTVQSKPPGTSTQRT